VSLGRRLAAEGIGTAFLLAIVIGSGIMGERLAGGNVAIALLGNTLATGAGLVVLITVFGPISGRALQSAVSLVARSALLLARCALYAVVRWFLRGHRDLHMFAGRSSPRRPNSHGTRAVAERIGSDVRMDGDPGLRAATSRQSARGGYHITRPTIHASNVVANHAVTRHAAPRQDPSGSPPRVHPPNCRGSRRLLCAPPLPLSPNLSPP
jgi:hypothetical protein